MVLHHTGEYRLVHDIISNHVQRTDVVDIPPGLKDSIQFLAQSEEFSSHDPIRPRPFYSVLDPRGITFPRLFLYFLIFWGAFRVLYPKQLYAIMGPVNDLWMLILPGSVATFDFQGVYAVPYVVTLLLWALFIHRVTYGYLAYTLRGRMARFLMHMILPFGGGVGALAVFAPSLLALPIGICGGLMGILLIWQSNQDHILGAAQFDIRRWGLRTCLNVLFSQLILLPTLYAFFSNYERLVGREKLLWGLGVHDIQFLILILVSIILVWSMIHIRPHQAEQDVWSMRFAMIDRSRITAR